jgi:hypothetical protein
VRPIWSTTEPSPSTAYMFPAILTCVLPVVEGLGPCGILSVFGGTGICGAAESYVGLDAAPSPYISR